MEDYIIQTAVFKLNKCNFRELLKISHAKRFQLSLFIKAPVTIMVHIMCTAQSVLQFLITAGIEKIMVTFANEQKKRIFTYLSKMRLENKKSIYFAFIRVTRVFPIFFSEQNECTLNLTLDMHKHVQVKFKVVMLIYKTLQALWKTNLMYYTDGYPFHVKLCQNNFVIKACNQVPPPPPPPIFLSEQNECTLNLTLDMYKHVQVKFKVVMLIYKTLQALWKTYLMYYTDG